MASNKKLILLALMSLPAVLLGCPERGGSGSTDVRIEFTTQKGAPGLSAIAYAVGAEASGSVGVVGRVSGCPRGSIAFLGLAVSDCLNHLFLARMNVNGAVQGATLRSMLDLGLDGLDSAAFDSSGSAYLVSSETQLLQFHDGLAPVTGAYRLVKVDANGTILWSVDEALPKPSNFPSVVFLNGAREIVRNVGVSVDSGGNVYVTGRSYLGGFFVTKHSANGSKLWRFIEKTPVTGRDLIDTTTADVARFRGEVPLNGTYFVIGSQGSDAATDEAGNVYVVGKANIVLTGDPANFGSQASAFLAKLDSSGRLQWLSVDFPAPPAGLPQNGGFSWATRVAVDGSTGAVWTAGETHASDSVSPGYFLSKYDGSGQMKWTRSDRATGSTVVRALALDEAGNSFLGGLASGPYLGEGSSSVGSAAVLKFGPDGERKWTLRQVAHDRAGKPLENGFWNLEGIGVTSVSGLAVDSQKRLFVTGSTHGRLQGQSQQSLDDGSTDFYLQRVDSENP